jgi:dihydroflavonol-4-reductase
VEVAVTGATGFVGQHLVALLRREGHSVRAIVRSPGRGAAIEGQGVRLIPGDLADMEALARLAQGAEIVIHLAGLVMARSEQEFMRVNRDGTESLARACRAAQVRRLVLCSSLAATGPVRRGEVADEASPPRPVTRYGRSKLAGEEVLRRSGVAFTIVRPVSVYGPHDTAFLRLFRATRLGFLPLLGDGYQELSLIHAADLARALWAAAETTVAEGRTYHACHPEVVTQRDLARAIALAMGRRVRLLALPARLTRILLRVTGAAAQLSGQATQLHPDKGHEFLAPAWVASSEALTRDTGWQAEIDLARGLADTADWYRKEGWV